MVKQDDLADMRAMLESLHQKLDAVIMSPRPEWMTVPEYADMCGVTTRTVRNWIASGEVETYRNGSKVMVRINRGVSQSPRRSRNSKRATG